MDNFLQNNIHPISSDDIDAIMKLPDDKVADDPHELTDYFRLTDVNLRRRIETPRGVYLAESANVIERALRAGHRPRSFILETKWLDKLSPLLHKAVAHTPCPIFVGDRETIATITGYQVHRGAIAAMHRPTLPPLDDVLAGARRIAVLEDIVDHTNVGAIFRSAAALGMDAVIVTPRCADPLYRRAIRVSMGTVFQIPWTRMETWPPTRDLHAHGFHCVALALDDNSVSLDVFEQSDTVKNDKIAFILGSEGPGLTPQTLRECDTTVRIDMAHGVDSLNVAAASAVVFWAIRHRS